VSDLDRPLFSQLAAFACGTRLEDVPPKVIEQAKLTFQHNLLVALAARRERLPGQDWEDWPTKMPRSATATRLTTGRPAPIERAVVTNALAMGARAQHDEYPPAISHFGSTVLPPLLAIAERTGANGAAVLTGMIVGYEVGGRIGAATVQAISRRGLRPTGLFGPIAGATAAARAAGADIATMTSAMAFAANTSAGVTQTWLRGTDEWKYQTAFASRNAYIAAALAAEGATGAADTLEGRNGFIRAFAATEIEPGAILDGLSERWALEHILLKPLPVCAFNQAPVQQLLAIKQTYDFGPDDVEQILIVLTPDDILYPGVDNTQPVSTRAAALMCLRTCAALALTFDDVDISHLEHHAADPAVRHLAARIDLGSDDSFSTHQTTVAVTLRSGSCLESGPPAPVVYDASVSAALVKRLQPLTGLDDEQLDSLTAAVRHIEGLSSIEPILEVVRATG
jgi:2-methylcitrate dehydratase PrpD